MANHKLSFLAFGGSNFWSTKNATPQITFWSICDNILKKGFLQFFSAVFGIFIHKKCKFGSLGTPKWILGPFCVKNNLSFLAVANLVNGHLQMTVRDDQKIIKVFFAHFGAFLAHKKCWPLHTPK